MRNSSEKATHSAGLSINAIWSPPWRLRKFIFYDTINCFSRCIRRDTPFVYCGTERELMCRYPALEACDQWASTFDVSGPSHLSTELSRLAQSITACDRLEFGLESRRVTELR